MDHQFDADLAAILIGSHPRTARSDGRGRRPDLPVHLSRLLDEAAGMAREAAWAEFLKQYSRLLLKAARRASIGHDETMDRYTFILEQLRSDDFRRLRAFEADGRGQFTTWLVVVARRLCVDHQRRVHGRPQGKDESGGAEPIQRVARRNLLTLVADEIDLERLEDHRSRRPDDIVCKTELHDALEKALGSLDEADRLLLTLRFEDDVPMSRIGPIVGLESRFQVHRRLKAVLAQLREKLREAGITRS